MQCCVAPLPRGHFNPAVTCGLAVTRKITVLRAIVYVAAQCAGYDVTILWRVHLLDVMTF